MDMDLDAKVGECENSLSSCKLKFAERTKNRPLAAGRMAISEAMVFLSVHIVVLFYLCHLMNDLGYEFSLLINDTD